MPKVNNLDSREALLLARGIHMETTNYNPERDEAPVDVEGVIDLKKYYAQNLLPQEDDVTTNAFNNIEEPDAILGSPSDVFEQERMLSFVKERAQNLGKDTDADAVASAEAK